MNNITIRNKKANFDYTILDTYTAGISLVGTEIKSIRNGDVSLADSFCYFNGRSLFLKNSYIAQYEHGFIKHEERRDRVLLLTKNELRRIHQASRVPLQRARKTMTNARLSRKRSSDAKKIPIYFDN